MIKPLSRRTVLRGTGVAVGLPFLEAMLPRLATAQTNPPRRACFAWAGQIAHTPPGGNPTGPLPATLPPMWASLQPIRDKISIASKLSIPVFNVGQGEPSIPGGAFTSQHGNPIGPTLAGMYSLPGNVGGVHGKIRGETIDQVVGRAIGAGARFPVLVNITQASNYNGDPVVESYSRTLSGTTPQIFPGSRTPTELYSRLFGSVTPPPSSGGSAPAPSPSNLLLKKKSVLDVIDRGSAGLLGKLAPQDRAKMEEHFAQIRNLEKGLTAPRPSSAATLGCGKLAPPMAEAPPSTHSFAGWANETYRGQIGADILAMAFACDLTRSVLWMITRDQSWLGSQTISGVASDFHAMGHDIGKTVTRDQCFQNNSWVAGLWGRLVDNLSKIKEGTETLLDNTFTTLLFSEGNSAHGHATNHFPFAGMPAKFKMGQWFTIDAHPANYLVAACQGMGIAGVTKLGEMNGPGAAAQILK